MRKRVKYGFASIILMLLLIFSVQVKAAAPLDEIQDYTVQVDMRTDGTMDITYHVEWKVLDDSSEGPLSWVKIGVPNKHVDEITPITSNIKSISYMSQGGAYVRVDFDRKYKRNEIITFEYSIHQSYMYVIEKDNHLLRYSFTPGWFDEIEVKNITIKWNKNNVIESTAETSEGNYLVWQGTLGFGERLNASVKYNLDSFETNKDEQYTEESGSIPWGVIILIGIGVIVILAVILALVSDDYDSGSGFGGGYHSTYIYHGGGHSSCASSCACACACAGGGRAGCSKKDFYGTKLKTDMLYKILEEDK